MTRTILPIQIAFYFLQIAQLEKKKHVMNFCRVFVEDLTWFEKLYGWDERVI